MSESVTVGREGKGLHYRGYDILDLAAHCEFAEVAHLLVHGKLPNAAEKSVLGFVQPPFDQKGSGDCVVQLILIVSGRAY